MFSKFISDLAEHHEKKLPFVAYRKPKQTSVHAILQHDAQVHHVKDFTEKGFVFAPFDKKQPAILLPSDHLLASEYVIEKHSLNEISNDLVDDLSEKRHHMNLVTSGMEKIKAGVFQKVVLSRMIATDCESAPLSLFQNVLDTYDTAFCYLWYHPKVGTWLGATPEILLKSENQQLTTMSLAGTKKFVEHTEPEWGMKEVEEQQLVTDYISNALAETVSNLRISERESIRAGNLWHLRTKLTATMTPENLASVIDSLHPTPAVCGLPMPTTKEFILNHENYDREYYTGYLGELNFKTEKHRSSISRNQENRAYKTVKTTTTLFVNLRCLQLQPGKAHIYVGGGVTKDSDPEKEWQETVTKSNTMLRVVDAN